ncbi:MAG: TIGR03936 family radical SAM-associated protein [Oscillospiraceae bacterium]|nr:TIGR03936 family radical SAM-associated protein [Oscillospiraceae bacterium]
MAKTRFIYAKRGVAKYISHLDLMNVWRRTFNRAGIALTHSEGFNPHPYLSVALPLPVGAESHCEILDVKLEASPDDSILDKLNATLPPGLQALSYTQELRPIKDIAWTKVELRIKSADNGDKLAQFLTNGAVNIEKKSKSGMKTIDIVPHIAQSDVQADGEEIVYTVLLRASEPLISPTLLCQALAQTYPDMGWGSAAVTRLAVLDGAFLLLQ